MKTAIGWYIGTNVWHELNYNTKHEYLILIITQLQQVQQVKAEIEQKTKKYLWQIIVNLSSREISAAWRLNLN